MLILHRRVGTSDMTELTMAAGFAASFADYARDKGADRIALLAESGLTEDDLSDQDNRIPRAAYQTMIKAVIRQTGDTALLLRHTFDSRLETMSVVGQIVHTSSSLRHSFEQLNRYLHLMGDVELPPGADRYELQSSADGLWIIDHLILPPEMSYW